jgi:hypothetical protein
MLLTRKQATSQFVAVSQQQTGRIAWQEIERQEEGESRTAMSGYNGVGATRVIRHHPTITPFAPTFY